LTELYRNENTTEKEEGKSEHPFLIPKSSINLNSNLEIRCRMGMLFGLVSNWIINFNPLCTSELNFYPNP